VADQKTETVAAKADETRTPAPAAVKAAEPAAKAADAATPVAAKAEAPAAAAKTQAAKPARAKAAKPARAARRAQPKAVKASKAAPAPKPVRKTKTVHSKRIDQTKGTQTMKNETNKIADRVQAAFGDVNARAKTAFERNARFAEELTELQKGNVEALVASTKVAARGVETIGQEVAEMSRKSFEEASAALRSFAEVKSPTDFFRLQGDFARGQFDAFVSESAKLSEAMIKLAGDVAQPLTSRYSVAAEKVKTAVAL
jgi:phasin family protein